MPSKLQKIVAMETYLTSLTRQFKYYQSLGEKTFAQLSDEQLFWQYNADSNSIGTIVKHLWGNMLSRFTDFLTADGEKSWRNRESEFDNDIGSREELITKWDEGWACLYAALSGILETDLERLVYIRNEGHTVVEALNRQLAHYAYHVGQIVYVGKMASGEQWKSLSIPRGKSGEFNSAKFSQPKERRHFTEDPRN